MSDKAQFAVEHLLVIALGILVLIPVVYFFYNYSVSQMDEVSMTQINRMGNDILNNAESVYYMGKPSRVTLDTNMPPGVNGIKILGTKEVVFNFTYKEKYSEIAFSSNVPITGPYINETGTPCSQACYAPGQKHITMISEGENVSIVFK